MFISRESNRLCTVVSIPQGEMSVDKDETLDATGLMCPMPIVKLARKMKEMAPGQVLELLADDVGSKDDVPAWSNRTGNELLGTEQEGNVYRFYIKVK